MEKEISTRDTNKNNPSVTHTVRQKGKDVQIALSHSIVKFGDQYRVLDYSNNMLGKGAEGLVKRSIKAFKLDTDQNGNRFIKILENKNELVKIGLFNHDKEAKLWKSTSVILFQRSVYLSHFTRSWKNPVVEESKLGTQINPLDNEVRSSVNYVIRNDITCTKKQGKKHRAISKSYILEKEQEGVTLRDFIQRHKNLTAKQILDIIIKIAQALQYVHDKNVVHLDVKPTNIIIKCAYNNITNIADIKIAFIDFSFAKESGKNDNHDGDIMRGTPYYISPEMAHARGTTYASDIFALGRVFAIMFGARGKKEISQQDLMKNYGNDMLIYGSSEECFSFDDIFQNMNELSIAQKQRLQKVIQDMSAQDQSKRISLKSAVNNFEDI